MPLPPAASSVPLPGPFFSTYRRRASTSTSIRRKPVPALAIEDDIDTVDDPLWDGKTFATNEDVSIEAKVRKMSLEETKESAMGPGLCLKESDAEERVEKAEKGFAPAMERQPSGGSVFVERLSLERHSPFIFNTSASAVANAEGSTSSPPIASLGLSSASDPSSATSLVAKRAFRPFALLRRQRKQRLLSHGAIIPSLAGFSALAVVGAPASSIPATEDELVDAWMDIIVGDEEEDELEAEQPRLVSQAKPSRNVSIVSLASSVPPLIYASSSKPSSVTSVVRHEQSAQRRSEDTSHVADVGDESDGIDEFFDVPSGRSSEEWAAKLALEEEPLGEVEMVPPAKDPVESALPSTKPPPPPSLRLRFPPIPNRLSFSRAWPTLSPRPKDRRSFSIDRTPRRRKRSASISFSPTSSSPPDIFASHPPSPKLGVQIASRTIPPGFSLPKAPQR
ncbi:hypothetical protein JCM21900_004085 [Sporobolomyces salmonicolor]